MSALSCTVLHLPALACGFLLSAPLRFATAATVDGVDQVQRQGWVVAARTAAEAEAAKEEASTARSAQPAPNRQTAGRRRGPACELREDFGDRDTECVCGGGFPPKEASLYFGAEVGRGFCSQANPVLGLLLAAFFSAFEETSFKWMWIQCFIGHIAGKVVLHAEQPTVQCFERTAMLSHPAVRLTLQCKCDNGGAAVAVLLAQVAWCFSYYWYQVSLRSSLRYLKFARFAALIELPHHRFSGLLPRRLLAIWLEDREQRSVARLDQRSDRQRERTCKSKRCDATRSSSCEFASLRVFNGGDCDILRVLCAVRLSSCRSSGPGSGGGSVGASGRSASGLASSGSGRRSPTLSSRWSCRSTIRSTSTL